MSRELVYKEMKEMLGIVPSFFKSVPDNTLHLEWELFKKVQMEEGAIPNKYKELIGIGISAVSKCRYCTMFHTEMAKLLGATDAEIEEAVHYSKNSAGWSAYLNGLQVDYDTFKDEIGKVVKHVRKQGMSKAA